MKLSYFISLLHVSRKKKKLWNEYGNGKIRFLKSSALHRRPKNKKKNKRNTDDLQRAWPIA